MSDGIFLSPSERFKLKQAETERRNARISNETLNRMVPGVYAKDKLSHYEALVKNAMSAMIAIDDLDARAIYKLDAVLPDLKPFVDGYVDSGDKYPSEVFIWAFVWAFDAGDIDSAVRWGLYLIGQGCHEMPLRKFDSSIQTFFCKQVYQWSAAMLAANQPAAPYLDDTVDKLVRDKWSLHILDSSAMFAMAAKHANRNGDYAACVKWCDMAIEVNPDKHGVKGLRDGALKQIDKKNTGETATVGGLKTAEVTLDENPAKPATTTGIAPVDNPAQSDLG